ncbi:MAG: fasciclin domain-containing protein [Myxococcales bacterium]|jgi:uncharacterized surface protein with fasciclin (FAS1) repeats
MKFIVSLIAVTPLLVAACGQPMPPKTAEEANTVDMVAQSDIVDTANAAGQFKTLLAAVKAADLEATLRGSGPFTVFAPTDEAFAKLPAGTLDSLLKPENKAKLQAILTYHVVSGKVMSTEAVKLTSAKTVEGKLLKLDASSGALQVNGANVVKADIVASNGVIHVIDAVLLPE